MGDPFIRAHIDDLLRTVRTQVSQSHQSSTFPPTTIPNTARGPACLESKIAGILERYPISRFGDSSLLLSLGAGQAHLPLYPYLLILHRP